jgi:hypothetical protein
MQVRLRALSSAPNIAVPAKDIWDLAHSLIRVLDEEGRAVGPWNPSLDAETLRRGLRAMLLTRIYDNRMYRVQRQGKTSFHMKCTAEDALLLTGIILLEPHSAGTKYTAIAVHGDEESAKKARGHGLPRRLGQSPRPTCRPRELDVSARQAKNQAGLPSRSGRMTPPDRCRWTNGARSALAVPLRV